MTTRFHRRRALTGAAAVTLGLPVLAACSSDGGNITATDPTSATADPTTPSSPATTAASSPATGSALTTSATDDVPVGSGRIYPDQQVVVTQPTRGIYQCFTAVCTHQGCIVSSVSYETIRCECHGSAFSIADGSAVSPPATQPLAAQQITVEGDTITLA